MDEACSATIVIQAADKLGVSLNQLIAAVGQSTTNPDKSVDMAFKLMEMQSNAMNVHLQAIDSQISVLSWVVGLAGAVLAGAAWMWLNGIKHGIEKKAEKAASDTAGRVVEQKLPSLVQENRQREELVVPASIVSTNSDTPDGRSGF